MAIVEVAPPPPSTSPTTRALIGDHRCGTVCLVHLANRECLGSVPAPARAVQE